MPLLLSADQQHLLECRQQPQYIMQQQTVHQQHNNEHATAHHSWWHTLCTHPTAIPNHPTWSCNCSHCSAILLSMELNTVCCQNGQDALPKLPTWPPQFKTLLQQPAWGREFSNHSQVINSAFSFAGIGASSEFIDFPSGHAPPAVAITGHTYHFLCNAEIPSHSIHWFLYNEKARVFKVCLEKVLHVLQTHFGEKKYLIEVIEFQKRGFPHAHILIKVHHMHC